MMIILSKGFWFLLPCLVLLTDIFLAPINMASSWRTAIVER